MSLRIISQDGKINIPSDLAVFTLKEIVSLDVNNKPVTKIAINAEVCGKQYMMGVYADMKEATNVIERTLLIQERW